MTVLRYSSGIVVRTLDMESDALFSSPSSFIYQLYATLKKSLFIFLNLVFLSIK